MTAKYQSSEAESPRTTGLEMLQYAGSAGEGIGLRMVNEWPSAESPTTLPAYYLGKRALDLLIVFAILPVAAPVCLIIGAIVLLTSRGPMFFSHRRIGRHGEFFSMWKFRTMRVNNAEVLDRYLAEHPEARTEWMMTHKLRRDPRVTRIGRFLRKSSLDELPQMWNVLLGNMSLVGPRPVVAAEVEKYGDDFACYTKVKPGVTGLWQVSGRSRTTYEERIAFDCSYVRNWSLWGDIKILFHTLGCVISSDGAF